MKKTAKRIRAPRRARRPRANGPRLLPKGYAPTGPFLLAEGLGYPTLVSTWWSDGPRMLFAKTDKPGAPSIVITEKLPRKVPGGAWVVLPDGAAYPRKNPARPEVIYPRIVAIIAQKPSGQVYRHDFSGKAPILGLPDGSILIPAKAGHPLWGTA